MPSSPVVVLCYKNFAAQKGISHIGLGVSALNTCKMLRLHDIESHVYPIVDAADLSRRLDAHPEVTHCIVSAPWLPILEFGVIAYSHPNVSFTVNCHSNVGFLQADSNGVATFKDLIHAEQNAWNIQIAGNSRKFCRWVHDAFGARCLYLPNLYYLDETHGDTDARWMGGVLKIGSFGATRPLKNLMSAAAAAFEVAANLRCELQFWISGGRPDGGEVMVRAIQKLFDGETTRRLHIAPWSQWSHFRSKYVRAMHLLIQPSYTESFNMVAADAISQGVPAVVSSAMEWAPANWQADADDVFDIAQVARNLLFDRHAGRDGMRALEQHNNTGLLAWDAFLRGLGPGQHGQIHGHRLAGTYNV